ncbi:hypothetical protein Syun_019195 [Stephania yunnanensis]|uniref:K+ potassium transporter integral membrane domain-containing protein n=1 Tax=Stephania yunnanensis TaxID=152371 RepID=A0AAP0IVB9_9MAGN
MTDEALGLKKEGQRGLSQRPLPIRGSRTEPITSVHDLAVQSRALFNIKDSNKVSNLRLYSRSRLKGWSCWRSIQSFGTGKVGFLFAPVLALWFFSLGTIGIYKINKYD